ncbi:hypothetical protein LOD99_8199 [Oopsacas minuta]|uniref:PiggyBac transposable element-derived protein domain-containing protein n=1 Tax=Oopsacas minuta TaxID=111878 RepID=A0AAV7JIX1_9METZ|nr:hypothetical protein LOD99_8199 [Oopsacas minuta]
MDIDFNSSSQELDFMSTGNLEFSDSDAMETEYSHEICDPIIQADQYTLGKRKISHISSNPKRMKLIIQPLSYVDHSSHYIMNNITSGSCRKRCLTKGTLPHSKRVRFEAPSSSSEGFNDLSSNTIPTLLNVTSTSLIANGSPPSPATWSKTGSIPITFKFSQKPGINVSIPSNVTPGFFFDLFLTDQFCDMMVQETNRYAEEFLLNSRKLRSNSRFNNWKQTDRTEIRMLIGLLIHMGPVVFPKIADYWSRDVLYNSSLWRNVMS